VQPLERLNQWIMLHLAHKHKNTCAAVVGEPMRGGDFCRLGVSFHVFRIVAPLPHGIAHGEQLALEAWAGFARHQMQAQSHTVRQRDGAVLTGDQNGCNLLAGAP
jgi:hypothetical protein